MDTMNNSTRLTKVLIIGAITGMIAGAVMAMFTMLATATYLHMGFFTALYAIASPLAGQQLLMTSLHQGVFYFAPGIGLVGLVVHLMWSALFGLVLGLWPVLRPQDFASPTSRPIRQAA